MIIKLDDLYSKTVTESSKLNMHIYTNLLTKKELELFERYVKQLRFNGGKITNNAIRLCLKISVETGIKTFPLIDTMSIKEFSVKDGAYAWVMSRLNRFGGAAGSYISSKECIKKKYTLVAKETSLGTLFTEIEVRDI